MRLSVQVHKLIQPYILLLAKKDAELVKYSDELILTVCF